MAKKIEESKSVIEDSNNLDETKELQIDNSNEGEKSEGVKYSEEDKEVESLKKQLEEMKKIITTMMENAQDNSSEKLMLKEDETEIEIGTYLIQGVGFTSTDKTIEININYDETQVIDLHEMKKLLRQREIRELFENGVCYFVDESAYKLFGIKKNLDLSDEALEKLLSSDNVQSIIAEINKMTNNLKTAIIANCIIYKICNMIKNGELSKMDYITRKALENYFHFEFERGITTLKDLQKLRG